MARRIVPVEESTRYAIAIIHPGMSPGWLVGPDCDVQTYATSQDAEKALKRMKKNDNYSWTAPMEVREYPPQK